MASSNTNTSNTSGSSGPVPVLSATSHVPAVMMAPLSIRATVLRMPEFSEMTVPDLVEEGDILFDVLANPLHHSSAIMMNGGTHPMMRRRSEAAAISVYGVSSVLSLPTSVGKYFVGQSFRAFLNFHNAATYSLSSMVFSISCLHPTLHRSKLIDYECSNLEAKGNMSFTVESLLHDPGQHTLDVLVTYMDIVREAKRLTWSFSIQVEQAIMEVDRALHVIPSMIRRQTEISSSLVGPPKPMAEEVVSNINLLSKRYVLSLSLQNVSKAPLIIISVKLHTENTFQILPPPHRHPSKHDSAPPSWWPAGVKKPKKGEGAFLNQYTVDGIDALEDCHLFPNEKQSYFFEFVMKPEILRSLPLQETVSGVSSPGMPSSLTEVGYVEWKWCHPNGDSGTERARRIRLEGIYGQSTLEFFVIDVKPDTPKVGNPITLECVAINYDTEKKFDVALRVRPELLAPAFVYAGSLVSPLGLVEPCGTLTFRLSLVPWRPGWVALQGGLELCDARAPETLLWPLPLVKAQPLPSAPSTTLNSLVINTPEPLFPPVLCELLVF